jgi:predicted acylesterase/phospholipase RssA
MNPAIDNQASAARPSRRARPAAERRRAEGKPRVALAIAGGGPLGAVYEIGALCALAEHLRGVDFNRMSMYVGVSAGGFMAAALANGITPREMCRSFVENESVDDEFDPALLLKPAWNEYARRLLSVPALMASAAWRYATARTPLISAFERLGRAIPTGVFSNDEIDRRLAQLFSKPGRSNDFRKLEGRLVLVATDLDSGTSMPFGLPGADHVPISRAVQASAALPGLFPPVEIDGRHYVDGALKKTLHASVALDAGCDLLICLNPIVPFDARMPTRLRVLQRRPESLPRLVDGGLPTVLSQTFRAMIHSRMALGMRHYARSHPQTDIVLFEPEAGDAELFFANMFSYAERRKIAEHAYQATRRQLSERRRELMPKFERHGITLDLEALADPHRRLIAAAGRAPRQRTAAAPAPGPSGRALQQLEHVLDELSASLEPLQAETAGLR